MSNQPSTTYADWKAPADDGGLLIWPDPTAILRQTTDNQRNLSACDAVRFQGLPLAELRKRARAWIGHDNDLPLIATGHQTELYHPGVWAKNALIHHAATRLGGFAYHLAVDTDEPKHLHLRWPGAFEPITDDQNLVNDRWAGLLLPPTPAHINNLLDLIAADSRDWPFQPCLPQVLESIRSLLIEATDLSSLLVDATHEFDWSLGLHNHALMASPLWASQPFLIYAHHLFAHADHLSKHYNAALEQHRIDHNITTPGRPMPDLVNDDKGLEVPFWIDDLANATRRRARVQRVQGHWTLTLAQGQTFSFDPSRNADSAADALASFLRETQHRISPRALTLTMFMRLLVADNFVHGIGGGRYDQVLDRIITRCFNIAPPAFAITTATLLFPTAAGRDRVCLPCLKHQGHRLRHAVLGDKKKQFVQTIQHAPAGSPERAQLFHQMHRELASLQSHPSLQAWQQDYDRAEKQFKEEQILFNRELFYPLQPRDRLESLVNQYANAFAQS